MKKNALFLFVLLVLTVGGISAETIGQVGAFTTTADTPIDEGGDGFVSGDPCGYVYGTGARYNWGTVELTAVGNSNQGCAAETGYFYEDSASGRDSKATYTVTSPVTTTYNIDFVGTSSPAYGVLIDQSTGEWSGYARITGGSLSGSQRWIWFDWSCSPSAKSDGCTTDTVSGLRVHTDLTTGATTGYAWNDGLGFISFNELNWELPPQTVDMYVDVLSSDGTNGPEDVTALNAPIADGYDYWRVRLQFTDQTGAALDASDISSITITPDASGTVYLNQVEDSGNAIVESDSGTTYLDPSTGTYTTCSTTGSCVMTESTGETSWNTFIRSAAPTSEMIGLLNDTDAPVDFYGDRPGCRWIYRDQWDNVDGSGSQKACPNSTATTADDFSTKADVFYDRVNNRNVYTLNGLTIDVTFTNSNTSINTGTYTTQQDTDTYTYTVHQTDGTTGLALNWRPRYQLKRFVAFYDAADHNEISAVLSKSMSLQTQANVVNTSAVFQHVPGFGGLTKPGYTVKYQLEVTKPTGWDLTDHDRELVMDTAADGTADCTRRVDTVAKNYSAGVYTASYVMGYGKKLNSTACPEGTSAAVAVGTNTVSNPTAEQWVCDNLRGDISGQNPQLSCYFTGYLPRIDNHAEPESMLVIGAINSTIDQDSFMSNDNTLSVLGATDTIKLRNKMYAQIVRYTLGYTASSSQGHLDDAMDDSSGELLSLLGGRLLYGEGDIIVDGSSSFDDKTVVTVGGNVIITGNVTGGRLGVVAFQNNDGDGGNVFIDPSVTELYANFFMDGALLSYDGVTVPTHPVEFDWDTVGGDEARLSTLLNQLYLNGSVVAHNTILDPETAPDGSSAASSWEVGDGTSTSDYSEAREHDLNMLRQYRRCYEVDSTGALTSTIIDCDEGEQLSTYGADNGLYNSFILDYSPADELPIFRAENGLFQ